jgi:malonate transporter
VTAAILSKLLAIFVAVAIGFVAGRMRWLGEPFGGTDPARVLGHAAFTIFVPALLFRTTARLDLHHMPWVTLAAFFVPVIALLLAVYAEQRWRWRHHRADAVEDSERAAARPATRAISAAFGNTVQIGIPLAAGVFGETGLGIHITVVGLHALVLLSVLTVLVELDLARARARHEATATLVRTLALTARNTVVHPVVLPVLAGMGWNFAALPLPGPLDETLALLGTAVSPLCLVLIGISLAYTRVGGGALRAALPSVLLKLVAQPALVLVAARWGFGLTGLPLSVVVTMAALPSGSNALLFAQRYGALEAETTAAIVISTFAFVATAPLWLALLAHLG